MIYDMTASCDVVMVHIYVRLLLKKDHNLVPIFCNNLY